MMKSSLLVFFLTMSFCCSADFEYKLEQKVVGMQKANTRFVEASVTAIMSTTDPTIRYIRPIIAYELSCEKEPYSFEHAREAANFYNPNTFAGTKIYYRLSNKTDDPSHVNGYQMYRAWDWLLKNPDKQVMCRLRYQSKAGFGASQIGVSAGSSLLPISVSLTSSTGENISSIKTKSIIMKITQDSGGGGGPGCVARIAHCTPLLMDLGRDGIDLGQAGIGVRFDILGNGDKPLIQWVAEDGNEAFLALDRNHNGVIDSGAELFGNGTVLVNEEQHIDIAPNGFVALAQYDSPELGGNDDGYISSADQIWSSLLLWLDHNADGISTVDEISQLTHSDVERINIIPKSSDRIDQAGNLLPLWSWASSHESMDQRYQIVDVYFKVLSL